MLQCSGRGLLVVLLVAIATVLPANAGDFPNPGSRLQSERYFGGPANGTITLNSGEVTSGSDVIYADFNIGSAEFAAVRYQSTPANDGGPGFLIYMNSPSPANDDFIGGLTFQGNTDLPALVNFGVIYDQVLDVRNGQDYSRLVLQARENGANVDTLSLGVQDTRFDLGSGTNPVLTFQAEDDDALGLVTRFTTDSPTPANNDVIGTFEFWGRNSTPASVQFARFAVTALDVVPGTEDGRVAIQTKINGSLTDQLLIGQNVILFGTTTGTVDIGSTSFAVKRVFFAEGSSINWDNGDFTLTQTGDELAAAGGTFKLAVGTTTFAPLTYQSGTNLTTAAVGANEFDGVVFYATAIASTRQVQDTEQLITLTSTNTLTNQTAVQPIFDGGGGPANGQVTIGANTTYFFECAFTLTALSASSHSVGFALGGTAARTREAWRADAAATAFTTASTLQSTYNTAANTTLVTAGTTTTFYGHIYGKIVVGTGGTLIPQVSQLTNSAAAVVGVDSYFRIWPVGSNSVVSVGNWN